MSILQRPLARCLLTVLMILFCASTGQTVQTLDVSLEGCVNLGRPEKDFAKQLEELGYTRWSTKPGTAMYESRNSPTGRDEDPYFIHIDFDSSNRVARASGVVSFVKIGGDSLIYGSHKKDAFAILGKPIRLDQKGSYQVLTYKNVGLNLFFNSDRLCHAEISR